jgi:hypothetical protein
MNTQILITYWHDDDVDTITTIVFENDSEADKFESFLDTINYHVIERKSAQIISADDAIKNIKECLC